MNEEELVYKNYRAYPHKKDDGSIVYNIFKENFDGSLTALSGNFKDETDVKSYIKGYEKVK